ncbi:MAG: site-specific integrase [Planctomycetes bacterium]|nr:site-specific integrase [Planctomycetota bacterium]
MRPRPLGPGSIAKVTRSKGQVCWRLDYRGVDGERIRLLAMGADGRPVHRKTEAQAMLNALVFERNKLRDATSRGNPSMPWPDALIAYAADREGHVSETYLTNAKRTIETICRAIGVRQVGEITMPKVLAWRSQRLRDRAAATANKDVAHVRALCAWLVRRGVLQSNPLTGIGTVRETKKNPRRGLSEAETVKLLAACAEIDSLRNLRIMDGSERMPITWTIFGLLSIGCRYGAMRQLTWADLDKADRVITIRSATTKTKTGRTIPVSDEFMAEGETAAALLARVLGRIPTGQDPLFPSPKGLPWGRTPSNIRRFLDSALEEAGIPFIDAEGAKVTIHSMRNTFVQRLLRQGVPPAIVGKLSGHKSMRMIMEVYGQMQLEDTRGAIARLPGLLIEPKVGTMWAPKPKPTLGTGAINP